MRGQANWDPPLGALATPQQPCLQLGSAPQVLQVPRAARKEVLDLRPGTRYHAQVRAQPSGPWYQGSWSAWSKPVVVDAMADVGKGQGRAGGCGQRSHTADRRTRRVLENGVGSTGQRVTGLRGGGSGKGYSCSVPTPMQAGSSPVLRWCRCSSQQCSWGCGAPSPPSTGKGLCREQAGGSSTKPGHLIRGIRAPQI